jgi:hypothetical protein
MGKSKKRRNQNKHARQTLTNPSTDSVKSQPAQQSSSSKTTKDFFLEFKSNLQNLLNNIEFNILNRRLKLRTILILAIGFVFVISSFTLSFAFANAPNSRNFLKNSSFEDGLQNGIPKHWGTEFYGAEIVSPGKVAENCVKITNTTEVMSVGAQELKLSYDDAKKVTLSAYIKLDNIVVGPEDWNKVNIQVLFFDAKGEQVGGWPSLGPWKGSMEWTRFAKSFHVPKGTKTAKVVYGLFNCTGTAYFDDIQLSEVIPQERTDPYNLLNNGEFDIWEAWAYGGSEQWGIVFPAKSGVGALWIKNDKPIWSFASQTVPLDGKEVKKIEISGYVKAKDIVRGAKSWQKARVNIEFKDGKGKRIGGWPIVEAFDGTFDWKKVSNTFQVPPETKRVDVYAGLLECKGEAWFDNLRMLGFTEDGRQIKRGQLVTTDTSSWWKFEGNKELPTSAADVSYLLDAPAGKHGFLRVKNGHFYFEDGTRVRFWGTNIYAPHAFPDKKDAEFMAKRLARAGCNLVRIHHLDAFWSDPNIFDKNYNDTMHLSADALDRLDYLLYQLKKNGIYVFMDLLVDREFKEGDGVKDYQNVERGAKFAGFYNKRIIELQKKYAKDLLTHYNPYTELRYVDDPSVVSAKLINEATLFYIGTQFGLSEVYMKELDSLWNAWLLKEYGSRASLKRAWTDRYGKVDLKADENPLKGNVKRGEMPLSYQRGAGADFDTMRERDTMRFYYEVQNKYFKEMEAYLKSIGVKVPISGSNHWVNIWADVKSNIQLDYIDRHRYWDHPQLSYGTEVIFENQPMVKNPADALPNNFAYYKVKDVPFVVSEWNCAFPNEYRIEGPVIMAAYANLHDWDGVLQFSFNNAGFVAPMEDNFDISAWPNTWAQWPAAALLFYRGDVSSAQNTYEQVLSDQEIFGLIKEDYPIADEPFLPLITKTQISFGRESKVAKTDYLLNKFHDEKNNKIFSDTNELTWDYGQGIFNIDTKRTQGVIGFIGKQWVETADIKIYSNNDFCSVIASSLDDEPLSKAKHVLVSAGARIENKGMAYNETKSQLKEVGTPPILVEGIDGEIRFERKPSSVSALDVSGKKIKDVRPDGNGFKIRKDDKAFFYEVIF